MADEKKKDVFTATIKDKEVKIAVERPNQEKLTEAQKVYNKTFRDSVESGAIVRAKVNQIMVEQNLWNDEIQKKHDDLVKKIADTRHRIPKGGMKLEEAKKLAFQCKEDEAELRTLRSVQNSLDVNTAEAQAENARFNRLVSLCTVYNDTGKPYFATHKDYLDNPNDPVGVEAATKLAYIIYNLDPNFEANLPENKFLKTWKMVDEQLRPINKQGKLVDFEGRLVDEKGRFIDEQGKYVDREGNPVDVDGNYVPEEVAPFLDDDGNPLVAPEEAPPVVSPA